MDGLGLVVKQFLEAVDVLLLLGADEDAILAHAGHPSLLQLLEGDVLTQARREVVLVLGHMRELVNLVEDHDHLLAAGITHLLQGAVHHLDLLLELGMRDIDNVDEDVAVAHLVEGALEGFHQMGGQLADEAYGVGQQERQVRNHHLAHSRVKGSKELVLGKHLALAQHVHQRGFAHVGIAHKGDARELAAVLALGHLLLVELGQFLLEQGNLGLDNTAVGLNLGLTRAAHADAASLAFKVGPHTRQSWQQVLVLSQFDLHLGAGSLSPLGKDVQDEASAVQGLDLYRLLDKGNLLGREVVIKDDQADVVVLDIGHNFLKFALTHVAGAVGAVTALQEGAYGDSARRLGKEFKFIEVLFGLGLALLGCDQSHEDGALLAEFYFVYTFFIVNESHCFLLLLIVDRGFATVYMISLYCGEGNTVELAVEVEGIHVCHRADVVQHRLHLLKELGSMNIILLRKLIHQ